MNKNNQYIGHFSLVDKRYIAELKTYGCIFQHKLSGITVISLENEDPHKVFSISFMTLPEDNKGTAHIIEHAVCCASEQYPLKETFTALGQGSICTTLNACTYLDRTMYYVASPHEKDISEISKVIIDLVFHPCMKEDKQYFLQEGWRYMIHPTTEELELSGVVYHEMIGQYGEPSSYLELAQNAALFPDTSDQYDAGGLPCEVRRLSQEEFLNFYNKHYVGNNAIITVYGDMDLQALLIQLDRQLMTNIPKGEMIMPPTYQMAFHQPKMQCIPYPTLLTHAPTLLSLSFVIGKSLNCEERIAIEILEHILLRNTASPLLKKLIQEEGLGRSLSEGGYDSNRRQPVFSIILKDSTKEKGIHFQDKVLEVLEQLVQDGIDPPLIDAALAALEFELRETDASYEPIGLIYTEMILSSYLYGGDAFTHLMYRQALDHIKSQKRARYFENLLQTMFLDNNHRLLTVLYPSQELYDKEDQALEIELNQYKDSLSKEQLGALRAENNWLEREQLKENTETQLDKLPYLSLADMPLTLPTLSLTQKVLLGCDLQLHEDDTNDIVYLHFLWDASTIPSNNLEVLGVFAHLFTYTGTESRSYSVLENDIYLLTGGINSAIHAYEVQGKCQPVFKVSCKVLLSQLKDYTELMVDIFNHTAFNNKAKIKELIGHTLYEMERSFTGAPEYRAVSRVYSYLSVQGAYEDKVAGIAFYQYLKVLYDSFDEKIDALLSQLNAICTNLFFKENLKLCATIPHGQQQQVCSALENIIATLNLKKKTTHEVTLELNRPSEGFINGQADHAIAMGYRFSDHGKSYKGQYEVIANILENTFLWDHVRLKGGAYGCEIALSKEGYLVVYSYCDPNLSKTLKVFKEIGRYLKTMSANSSMIEKAIISTLGAMIAPASMEQKSERACMYFITDMTQEKRQQLYNEIAQTRIEDFYELGLLFEEMAQQNIHCVFGSKKKLHKQKNNLLLIDLN